MPWGVRLVCFWVPGLLLFLVCFWKMHYHIYIYVLVIVEGSLRRQHKIVSPFLLVLGTTICLLGDELVFGRFQWELCDS